MTVLSLPETYLDRVEQQTASLQSRFDTDWRIHTDEQHAAVLELKQRIGAVNWKEEGYASPDNQRDLSINFHWGHNHLFAEDLEFSGRMRSRHVLLLAELMEGFSLSRSSFASRSVLDIGCWTGGTSLMLRSAGAGRIHAIEEVKQYAVAAQDMMSGVFGLDDIAVSHQSLFDLEMKGFDLAYYPGVIYHVSDPVLSLRLIYNALNEGGVCLVESAGIQSDESVCEFHGNRVFHQADKGGKLSRGGWNWFIPSALCLERWMIEAGFDNVRTFRSPVKGRVYGYGERRGFVEITRAGFARRDVP